MDIVIQQLPSKSSNKVKQNKELDAYARGFFFAAHGINLDSVVSPYEYVMGFYRQDEKDKKPLERKARNCTKGISCGNSCIPSTRTCKKEGSAGTSGKKVTATKPKPSIPTAGKVKLKLNGGDSVDLSPQDIKVMTGRDKLTATDKKILAKNPLMVVLSKRIAETGDPVLMKKYEGVAASASVGTLDDSIPKAMLKDIDAFNGKKGGEGEGRSPSVSTKKITTLKSLQDEAQANGVTAEKTRGRYYLGVGDKPLFNLNRSAGDIKTAAQTLSDYKLLKDNGIDPQKYSQTDVQSLLDKVTLKEWGVKAPSDKDFVTGFYTKNHYLADELPGTIRASKALKDNDYDNLTPQDLLALSKRSDGLKKEIAEPFLDNTIFKDTQKLDDIVKTYLTERYESKEWQDSKKYNSKVFGDTADDRRKTFETIAAKMYIDKLKKQNKKKVGKARSPKRSDAVKIRLTTGDSVDFSPENINKIMGKNRSKDRSKILAKFNIDAKSSGNESIK